MDGILSLNKAAEVDNTPLPWHCIRHTFGTELAAAGVPVTTIKELMGHRSIVSTLKYIHVDDEARSGAIVAAFGRSESEMGPSWARDRDRKEKSSLTDQS